jgi:hypothetical protein
MTIVASIRGGLLVTVAACAAAAGQTLPATAPTTAPAVPATGAVAQAASQSPSQQAAKRADVQYATGVLSVSADNSSLNQILRDIGRATGMKITGGVTDERVYGSYGPADTSTVLSALLKGTGSNMMLVLDRDQSPRELVLTPRGGGPTPPSPNAGKDREDEDLPPQRMPHNPRADGGASQPPQFHPPQPLPTGAEAAPQPAPTPVPADITPQPAAATANPGDTTQRSPNGVPTPQDIYDQLMKRQQQQKATPPQTPPQ